MQLCDAGSYNTLSLLLVFGFILLLVLMRIWYSLGVGCNKFMVGHLPQFCQLQLLIIMQQLIFFCTSLTSANILYWILNRMPQSNTLQCRCLITGVAGTNGWLKRRVLWALFLLTCEMTLLDPNWIAMHYFTALAQSTHISDNTKRIRTLFLETFITVVIYVTRCRAYCRFCRCISLYWRFAEFGYAHFLALSSECFFLFFWTFSVFVSPSGQCLCRCSPWSLFHGPSFHGHFYLNSCGMFNLQLLYKDGNPALYALTGCICCC